MSILLISAILGVVEGLTEFLPISSTGHLIVVGHLLGFRGEVAETFDIFIQTGAILAVVIHYRSWLRETVESAVTGGPAALVSRRTLVGIGVAVMPSLAAGAGLHGLIKHHLFQPWTVAVGMGIGGVAILAVERWRPSETTVDLGQVTLRQAGLIGAGQCLSLWPGVSRSAATILSGLMLGLDHSTAAAFSFLLSIPTLGAAAAYDLLKSWQILTADDLLPMGIGFLVSFLVAWGAIAGLLRYLRTHSLRVFGWYRLAIGALIVWIKP